MKHAVDMNVNFLTCWYDSELLARWYESKLLVHFSPFTTVEYHTCLLLSSDRHDKQAL